MLNLLIVDDNPEIIEALRDALEKSFQIHEANSGKSAIEIINEERIDLAILDIGLPDISGEKILTHIQENTPHIPTIMLSGSADIDIAVRCIKNGAIDFIQKPYKIEQVRAVLAQAQKIKKLEIENTILKTLLPQQTKKYIYTAPRMLQIMDIVKKVGPNKSTVLILGETGVGKEVLAREIHAHSQNPQNLFIAINCGAIPENLLESELFGYKRGAFTGADEDRQGKFELANGGTIFLDEIGTMPMHLQIKLLRVLQERVIERVGDAKPITIELKVIAATNGNIQQLCKEGKFREDLYYRLSAIPIVLPPLRERQEDILPLAEHFAQKYGQEYGYKFEPFTSALKQTLLSYNWPGNIRELENVMQRYVLLNMQDNSLIPSMLGNTTTQITTSSPSETNTQNSLKDILNDYQKEVLKKVLTQTKGSQSQAAEILKIDRSTLSEKVKQFSLESLIKSLKNG